MRQTAGVIERKTYREERMTGVIERKTYREERMTGVIERKTYREERMTGVNRTKDISTEPHRRAEQPPRAQSPLPELKPAGRNMAPARNSLTCKAQQRIAAIARNIAISRNCHPSPALFKKVIARIGAFRLAR